MDIPTGVRSDVLIAWRRLMYDILIESRSLFLELFNMHKGDLEWEKGKVLFVSLYCRDPATADHSLVVAFIAYNLAISIRGSSVNEDRMFLSGLLHDIGKLAMPDDILKSSKRLTFEERSLVVEHVQAGYNVLSQLDLGQDILHFCYSHHERIDGSGYPHGIADRSEIGRIAAISDVYSACKLPRIYRSDCLSDKEIIEFLIQNSGKFDIDYTLILKDILQNCLNSLEIETTKDRGLLELL
jgi:putative nucleotidyltransferase with HDIG domain